MCDNKEAVKVTYKDQGSKKGWNISHCGVDGGPGSYPHLKAGYDESPTFSFQIHGAGPGGGQVYFAPDPVWVGVGTAKPTKFDSALLDNVSGAGTTTLTFHDPNNYNGGDAVTLTYILRFSDGSYTDPIIDNGGCCHGVIHPGLLPTTTTAFIADLAIAFFVGVIVALLARRLLSSRSSTNPPQARSTTEAD
ncbi:MAG TPA: hypothetical protein VIV07_03340 [Sphingomicrobium sp.]